MKTVVTLIVTAFAWAGAANAQSWQKLIGPAELAALEDVTVLDIRDAEAYAGGHPPGAVNAPYPAWRGPPENPGKPLTDRQLTELLQGIGVTPDSRVVVAHAGADQTDFGAAARVYWTLKSAGLETIAILNGGVRGWAADGRPLSTEIIEPERSTAMFTLSDQWSIDREGVAKIVAGERKGTLIDARPTPFFRGEKKHPAARVAGTIATAVSKPFAAWFDNGTEMVDAEEMVARASGIQANGETVSFCNTGHWAATNWFALSELAGKENVKLYPESVVGWLVDGGEVVNGR